MWTPARQVVVLVLLHSPLIANFVYLSLLFMDNSQLDHSVSSSGALTWVFASALVVTVLFTSFALFFSRSLAADADPEEIETAAEVSNYAPELSAGGLIISTVENPGTISSDSDFGDPAAIIGTQQAITPTASTTLSAYIHIIARDLNGWDDINLDSLDPGGITYVGSFEHEPFPGPQCLATNGYDCYDAISNANCELVAQTDHVVQVRCPISLSYFTKAAADWDLVATVFDRSSLSDTQANNVTINNLLAYNLSVSTLDFGSVTVPVTTLANSNVPVRLANSGNTAIADLQIDHEDMTCKVGGPGGSLSGTISVDHLAYSTSTLAALFDFAVTGSQTGTDFAFAIPAETNLTGYQSKEIYHHLRHVDLGTVGTCTGTVTYTPNS